MEKPTRKEAKEAIEKQVLSGGDVFSTCKELEKGYKIIDVRKIYKQVEKETNQSIPQQHLFNEMGGHQQKDDFK